jgi:hypothetical protein
MTQITALVHRFLDDLGAVGEVNQTAVLGIILISFCCAPEC